MLTPPLLVHVMLGTETAGSRVYSLTFPMNDSLNEFACSWASFQKTHKHIVDGVMALSQRIKADAELTALITKKFAIKCTTGYSINALVGMCVRGAIGGEEKGEACAEKVAGE